MKWIAATVLGALLVAGIPFGVLQATGPPQRTYHGHAANAAIFTQEVSYQPAVSPR